MRRSALAAVLILLTPAVAWASNDPLFAQQWALFKVGAEQAWSTGQGAGITIAIVDTGVDLGHEDLARKIVPGHDFVDNDSNPDDGHDHGTHVAGIAAAMTGNSRGVAGIAPDAKIMPVRVLDENGEGSSDDVDAGIRWAVDHGANVVNLSLSDLIAIRLVFGSSIERAINYAWSKGAVPVLAAGNDLIFPSGYSGVNGIAVAATNDTDGRPIYSNGTGDAKWGMAAPGDRIISSVRGNKYASFSGTSMAAPHVAGAAAVLLSLGLSPQQTVDRLLTTSKDIGSAGHDGSFGSGRLDLAKAVAGLGRASESPAGAGSAGNSGGGGATAGGSSKSNSTPNEKKASPAGQSPTQDAKEPDSPAPDSDDPTKQAQEENGERNPLLVNAIVGGLLLAGVAGLVLWSRLRRKPV